MNHLIFSLQATMPVFFLIVLGYVFKQTGLFTQSFVKGMNRFVFVVALPVLLFKDLATENFVEAWDGKYILFCLIVTLLSIAIAYGFSLVISSRKMRGEFIQAAYRSSAAILGIAFIQNIYGSSGAAPFMIIATVPLYNIMAVIVLNASAARQNEGQAKEIVKGILTNPIIIGIGVGLLWSLFSLPYPVILSKTVDSVSALASPMGLMALGGSVTTASVYKVWKPVVLATFLKLIGFVMLFLPLAVFL
ncbi:MAG: AEC family transporter, partial [Erysipelotrichaceae bacterium]|nr:AEC family transporter [Erysipelotrichaceae bacterium]